MRDEAKFVLILLFTLLLFGGICFYFYKKESDISDPGLTYGILHGFTTVGAKGMQKSVYSYEVNGQVFQTIGHFNTTLVLGEKFQIIYSISNPGKSGVVSYKPLFLKNEAVGECIGVVKDKSGIVGSWIAFEYEVGDVVYFKVQDIDPKISLENVNVGDTLKVIYFVSNPQRSILDLH